MIHEPTAPAEESLRQRYYLDLAAGLLREKSRAAQRPLTFCVVTFGCQMNARDSEKLRGMLCEIGYVPVETEEADLVIYNTCTVRENANNRVYGRLGYLHSLKDRTPDMKIALCGCMMQEQTALEHVREHFPFVDLIFGTHNLHRLPELLARVLADDSRVIEILEERQGILEDLPTRRTYPFKSGVNIMYGCNNFCSYCIVPYVRGREVSRPSADILAEVERLLDEGVKEIMLLGQNVNSYGKTLEEPETFSELLDRVAGLGVPRVRFMTSHPKDLSEDLIRVIERRKNVCRHLHLPLQSGSDRILAAMNRGYSAERYMEIVQALREAVPEISLTTDLIVGFPGETEEDHEQTLDVVRRARFDTAFTFQYSKRAGTPAAQMKEQVPSEVVQERFDRLLRLVQEIGREQSGRFLSQTK